MVPSPQIPGCDQINPLGCRKQSQQNPGEFPCHEAERIFGDFIKEQWRVSETRADQVLGETSIHENLPMIYHVKNYISMYVWTYICKTYMHIICTSTWHKCIDIQSHKISTGFVPNWTSSISSPQRGMNTKHTHTQEHLLNPPNMKHVNMCWKLPSKRVVSLWSLSAGKPWSPSWSWTASLSHTHTHPIGRRIVFQPSNFQGYGFIVILTNNGLFNNPHLYNCVDYVVFHPLYHQNNQEA